MDADEFWALIEASAGDGDGQDEREAWLSRRLRRVPRADLLDFVQHLAATREPANTYRLWHAADLLCGGYCSTDGFHYFQMWLVGNGRAVYDAAIADPDSLAAAPQVAPLAAEPERYYPGWESLEYVARRVGLERDDIDGDVRDVVTAERQVRLRFDPKPEDLDWRDLDEAAVARAYPRLWALFGDRRKRD
ncbi:DUF4240 domain-containing protein [Dactylosporangium siamense]|uniref:DUF4240 domain-containing protein n=1 Tax=Dactylosporangium siamense TaxID=685454 RepID=A0A919PKX0_9ACTN|nr:DUF4240 domain-containing protein [Dactylosporangium siamense]GIG44033.1 hypothetical protein Dsi01nite_020740 [Dactylosporangium siamense]